MLLRLDVVEEIGRFAMLKHKAEQFRRLSLVFARNGCGKSTLCAILRSASESQPNYIAARRRLGAKKESRVQSSWASGSTVSYGGGKWNSCPGKVYVFDQEFVHQNLHVGDSVTRDNKRSLLPVVLGEQGVALAQKIIDLDKEQRDLDTSMKKHSEVIRAKCSIVTPSDLLAFCTSPVPADIALRIESASRAVQLAKLAVTVKQKKKPKTIVLPSIEHFRAVATRTIMSVSQDVSKRVREHIETHQLGVHADRWLKYGIEHLKGDVCPFCDQSISGLDLLAAYEAYFSEAFGKLLSDCDEAMAALNKAIAYNAIDTLAQENDQDFAFWEQVCDLPKRPTMTTEERALIVEGLAALRTTLEQKIANPLAVAKFEDHAPSIEGAFAVIGTYNDGIAQAGVTIDNAKAEAQQAELSKAEEVHAKWVAIAAKQSDPIQSAAIDYANGDARRKEIEKEKKKAQGNLTSYADATMNARQTEINELLSDFGANFRLLAVSSG